MRLNEVNTDIQYDCKVRPKQSYCIYGGIEHENGHRKRKFFPVLPVGWVGGIHGAGQGLRRTAGDQSAPRVSTVFQFALRSPERLPD